MMTAVMMRWALDTHPQSPERVSYDPTDAKEAVRFFYDIPNPVLAGRYLDELATDLQDDQFPPEVRSLGRTLTRWRDEILAWHRARASNGPAEAINDLVKRVKRAAFGFRRFRHYRIRSIRLSPVGWCKSFVRFSLLSGSGCCWDWIDSSWFSLWSVRAAIDVVAMWRLSAEIISSCTLDIRTELGLETFLKLVEQSDIVVENNSVATLDKLGIGWEILKARNPKLILMRMPPMSLDGPYASYVGFGASFEALCGLTQLRGYRDDDPTTTSAAFHMDPVSGATGAFALMCALRRRAMTGCGEHVELAQSENMMQHIGEYFVDADRTGRSHSPDGNRHVTYAPQGCYRCAGDDRWAVISVQNNDQWAGLCRAMGQPSLANDPRFESATSRMANHDALDALIETWTATLDHREVFARCQAEAVPAGPVLDEADAYADPHLSNREFFRSQGSEDIGTWDFPGQQWRWTGPDMRWEPICRLGDSNEYVYRELLGLSESAYRELEDGGHLSMDYLQPDGTPY